MIEIPLESEKLDPIYDISKSYIENANNGPFFKCPTILKTLRPSKLIDFLGYKIQSPIGVPSGPLLNSKFIELASKLGFDVLTYKTIRSNEHPGHPVPNMIFVETDDSHVAMKLETPPKDLSDLTLTNSFGMPSRSNEYLLEDIEKANKCLSDNQVMIVSIVGSQTNKHSLSQDFVNCAMLAKEAGAKIIEANFSCPNVKDKSSILYLDPQSVYEIAVKITKAIGPLPLIIKLGKFPSRDLMEKVMIQAAYAGVQGLCGINSISKKVMDGNSLALGELRPTSGICGASIRKEAISFIQEVISINTQNKLNLKLLGCGGMMTQDHFDEILSLGCDIAMSATAMMWDPYLALRWKKKNGYL